ncbi:Mov34/MPN/PAD-1 family protein [Caballeronia sp. GAWG1-1]|uniref:Mov34/MPN/PAD-1 family protein n=1 Tax=Caballeronia sp. GAWG1-1 TaxID=2921742 RepID=UPI0025404BD5|nr:Mov34/MPN/PAD-1 family protein [Caballeronia sp. GAWG1-1]
MQYLSSWATPDHRVLAVFAEPVLATFAAHRQLHMSDCEAGGVLLGRRRGRHFEITHVTRPFPTDTQRRTAFLRECIGHQEEASALWMSSGREIGYLGEWHTHPEQDPFPSGIDTEQWRKSSLDMRDDLPMLTVIVGQLSMYVSTWKEGKSLGVLRLLS